jgi:hypothetical protein
MFRRLCLYLLLACLALPAMALPAHCAPAPVLEAATHHGPHPDREMPSDRAAQHDCIGCIASFAGLTAFAEVLLAPVSRAKPINDLWLIGGSSGPETPPPRD